MSDTLEQLARWQRMFTVGAVLANKEQTVVRPVFVWLVIRDADGSSPIEPSAEELIENCFATEAAAQDYVQEVNTRLGREERIRDVNLRVLEVQVKQ